jgi:hypothetical protein
MGLLDDVLSFAKTPEGIGAMSAIAGGLAGARKNAPWNTLGAAATGGLMGYSNAQDFKMKSDYKTMQEQLMQAQIEQAKRKQSLIEQLTGTGQSVQNNALTALGHGSAVGDVGPTVTNADRIGSIPAQPAQSPFGKLDRQAALYDLALNDGKNIGQWTHEVTKPQMEVHNGYAYDKNKVQSGFLPGINVSQNGQATVTGVGPDGAPVVYSPPGALATYSAYQRAGEAAKAGFDTQEVTTPDGKKVLTTRGNVVNRITNATNPSFPRVSPDVQAGRDVDRKEIVRQELASNPNDPALRKEAQNLGIEIQGETSKQRSVAVAKLDEKAAQTAAEQAQGQQNLLNTLDMIDSRLKDKNMVLGSSPADRARMNAHEYGLQSKATINTARIRELGQQLVLARGSLGAGVSKEDAVRYDAAAGRFSDPKSYDDMVDAVKTMREIANTYIKQSDDARTVLETGKRSTVGSGGWSAVRR